MIKKGDVVRCESQARGSWVEKCGTVIAIVPAGAYGGLTHYYAPRVSVLEAE